MADQNPTEVGKPQRLSPWNPPDHPRLSRVATLVKHARTLVRTIGQAIILAVVGAFGGVILYSVYGSSSWGTGDLLHCLFCAISGALVFPAFMTVLVIDAEIRKTIGRVIAKVCIGAIVGAIWGATFGAFDKSYGTILPMMVGALIGVILAFVAKVILRHS